MLGLQFSAVVFSMISACSVPRKDTLWNCGSFTSLKEVNKTVHQSRSASQLGRPENSPCHGVGTGSHPCPGLLTITAGSGKRSAWGWQPKPSSHLRVVMTWFTVPPTLHLSLIHPQFSSSLLCLECAENSSSQTTILKIRGYWTNDHVFADALFSWQTWWSK